ncbi:hypothetical protein [Mucilaginibacter kameinonensis]|uniref:hypothetical protein n=1 Tax=Mucilaginibacter kameinonensis TaxID=452286 RepID=UPI000EF75FB7|nr:hypothetical protein [Mucilaginibacter kameinonensis]
MENTNHMCLQGKDVGDSNKTIKINLADDVLEVRGFGQPITRERAKQMAEAYFTDIEAADRLVQKIINDDRYRDLAEDPDFDKLKKLISPESQTVSGVFGKEIILQILAMKNCEGIRYIVGKDEDEKRNTIILIGVTDEGVITGDNGIPRASSLPLKVIDASTNNIPVDGEVHKASLTIAQTKTMLNKHNLLDSPKTRTDIIFGSF